MRATEITHDTKRNRIIAPPPFDPKHDTKQPLPVSRTRICIGLALLVSGFAVGGSSLFFPAAAVWLGGLSVVLGISSFFFLGLHRLRSRERDPRKLYGHERI